MENDICIIGLGRVGLPLALSLEEQGFSVAGVDVNPEVNKAIQNGKMPFHEPGYDELIKNSNIEVHTPDNYPEADSYVITVGTPLGQHIETDLTSVISVVNSIKEQINLTDKTIILRSTVAPYTTKHIATLLNASGYSVGENVFLAMCPERIVEGKAYEELKQLPQVIGAADDESHKRAKDIFGSFGIDCLFGSYIEAELAKLFTNGYRYINFAIPNYFANIAQNFGVDIFNLFRIMNTGYDRNKGLKLPGLSSGTCLRKDWGLINENFPQTDLFLHAYKTNEYYPIEPIHLLNDEMTGKNIGILGYSMKRDTDDTRDSLVPKIIRYINRYVPNSVRIHEPNLNVDSEITDSFNNNNFYNYKMSEVIKKSDIIFLAMNHSNFDDLDKSLFKGKIVIDYWGILGLQRINRL